jgi:hypothetical protein
MGIKRFGKHGASAGTHRNLKYNFFEQKNLMSKEMTNLASQIAQLGTGLAGRQRSVESDIVVAKKHVTPKEKSKNHGVRLTSADMALLDELQTWARQNKLRPGWGTLLKAGLRFIRKDEPSLRVLREILGNDGRKNNGTL